MTSIVEELRTNRESGAKRLESEYKAGLMTLARRFYADESDAEELVNRTLAEVVSGIDNYLEQSAFFGWMCKILENQYAKDVRRKSNRMVVVDPDALDAAEDVEAANRIFREVDAAILRDAIASLPDEMKDALMLRYFMDMPVGRVAKILSVPEGTVKWRLHCARVALAAKLGAAARKPGAKALLVALSLAAITAAGAATSLAVVRFLSPTTAAPSLTTAPLREGEGGGAASSRTSAADNENAPIYIVGNGSQYRERVGRMLVSGGELVNSQSDTRYFETQSYGQLDVAGGSVIATNVLFLNAYGSPGKVTVRDGGLLHCGTFRLSQTGTGTGGELFLCTNGVLRVYQIGTSGSAGAIHFNGGRLQRTSSSGDAIANASGAAWNSISFLVEAGGAVLDTSNGKSILFPKALSSGVADGETDGGLTCILSGGNLVVLTAAGSTYNGPTRLEGPNGTLQCRAANVLPAGTTLQVGPGTTADFSSQTATPTDRAQTVARLEGRGTVANNSNLTVAGAVAPVFDDTYGTLTLNKPCSLSGDLEIRGDASGCGCVKFAAAGQSIASLSLKVEDISLFSKNSPRGFYKIVDAPNGYAGAQFAATNLPDNWQVRYENDGIYLSRVLATVISLR